MSPLTPPGLSQAFWQGGNMDLYSVEHDATARPLTLTLQSPQGYIWRRVGPVPSLSGRLQNTRVSNLKSERAGDKLFPQPPPRDFPHQNYEFMGSSSFCYSQKRKRKKRTHDD